MVSLMTGCYLGEERLSLPQELPVIAELFKDAGYETAIVGKWQLNFLAEEITDHAFHFGFQKAPWELLGGC